MSLTSFEPINLLQNLENRSTGNSLKAFATAGIDSSNPPTY